MIFVNDVTYWHCSVIITWQFCGKVFDQKPALQYKYYVLDISFVKAIYFYFKILMMPDARCFINDAKRPSNHKVVLFHIS